MRTRRRSASGSSLGISYIAMYAHIWSRHVPTSRVFERGNATHNATGAVQAAAATAGFGSRARRLIAGAATPAATSAHAEMRSARPRATSGETTERSGGPRGPRGVAAAPALHRLG